MANGKWTIAGVPHSGWKWEKVVDEGRIGPLCEMCETQHLRYVHTVTHHLEPKLLHVGRECCAKLTEEGHHAEREEKRLRAIAGRKQRFFDEKKWKPTAQGGRLRKWRRLIIEVVPARLTGWTASADGATSGKVFASESDAMSALLSFFEESTAKEKAEILDRMRARARARPH